MAAHEVGSSGLIGLSQRVTKLELTGVRRLGSLRGYLLQLGKFILCQMLPVLLLLDHHIRGHRRLVKWLACLLWQTLGHKHWLEGL